MIITAKKKLLKSKNSSSKSTKTKVITLTNHNSKYMSPVPSAGKRVRKSRLVLVLLPIGRESGARFFNQSQSVAMQNQSNCGITFDTQIDKRPKSKEGQTNTVSFGRLFHSVIVLGKKKV